MDELGQYTHLATLDSCKGTSRSGLPAVRAQPEVGTTDQALTLISDFNVVITGLMVRGDLNPLDFIRRARSESGRPIIVVTACVYADSVTKAYVTREQTSFS